MFLLHLTQNLTLGLPLVSVAQSLFGQHLYGIYAGGPAAFAQIQSFADSVKGFLGTLGITVFIIGVIIAGMMRMMSFGSDRRVAVSNMALTAAVVGLVIMLMANTLSTLLSGFFKP